MDGVLDIYNNSDYLQNLLFEAIDRLANLVKRTRGKIVVISDWRYGKPNCTFGTEQQRGNCKNLVEALNERNIAISDVTFYEVRECTRNLSMRI